jgi:hypothetical protein
MDLPIRKKLPHTIPQWGADGSWFFITINCVPPGKNQLCRSDNGEAVLDAMKFNHDKFAWHCSLCLLMPDHLHAIMAFPREPGMATTIKNWKKVRRPKTRRGLATRFFRSSLARPSRTGRENQLHPDESGPQRFVPATGGLGVGLSSKRSPAAELVGRAVLCTPEGSRKHRRARSDAPYLQHVVWNSPPTGWFSASLL